MSLSYWGEIYVGIGVTADYLVAIGIRGNVEVLIAGMRLAALARALLGSTLALYICLNHGVALRRMVQA